MTRPFTPGEVSRFTATVHRQEAAARRLTQPEFAAVLGAWASNADRRADALEAEWPDLFGERA